MNILSHLSNVEEMQRISRVEPTHGHRVHLCPPARPPQAPPAVIKSFLALVLTAALGCNRTGTSVVPPNPSPGDRSHEPQTTPAERAPETETALPKTHSQVESSFQRIPQEKPTEPLDEERAEASPHTEGSGTGPKQTNQPEKLPLDPASALKKVKTLRDQARSAMARNEHGKAHRDLTSAWEIASKHRNDQTLGPILKELERDLESASDAANARFRSEIDATSTKLIEK
ncbi:hypothetical protein [Schlesneria sp. DSM 10557]|uniref:hypothetical protein n=1 Tax=Schlesneria sp. DSM 10557 TaxID=3044399 RepID=UPI0035A071D0